MSEKKEKRLVTRIEADLAEQFEAKCRKDERTVSRTLRMLIVKYLDEDKK